MNEKKDIIQEAPLETGAKKSRTHTTQKTLERRVNAVFIPYGTLDQLRDNVIFRSFLISFMNAQQTKGENFMDALMKAAKEWNNSSGAQEQGFRMTTNIGPTKSQRIGGRLIKTENSTYLKQTLGIEDYKTKSICDALGFSERELWPEIIRGKNQYSKGVLDPHIQSGKNQYSNRLSSIEDFKKWWRNGWNKRYKEIRNEKKSPRDAIRQAGQEYNEQQVSDDTKLNITKLTSLYRKLTHAK